MKKRRKPPSKFDYNDIKMALIQSGGNITLAGKLLKLPPRSLYDKLDRDAELREFRDLVLLETIEYVSSQNIQLTKPDGFDSKHTNSYRPVKELEAKKYKEDVNRECSEKNISESDIKKSLEKHTGNITACSRELGVEYYILYQKIKNSPVLTSYKQAIKQKIVDTAEQVIIEKLEEGNEKVAMFILETQGKEEGYSKKTINELTGKDGTAIAVENKIVSIVKDANDVIDTILWKM